MSVSYWANDVITMVLQIQQKQKIYDQEIIQESVKRNLKEEEFAQVLRHSIFHRLWDWRTDISAPAFLLN